MVEWSIFNEIFAVAFNVLYFVIIIGTIFIVILDNRNPVKTKNLSYFRRGFKL